jgi:hypothetical protein
VNRNWFLQSGVVVTRIVVFECHVKPRPRRNCASFNTLAPSLHCEPSLPKRELSVVRPSELPAHLDNPAERNYRDAIFSFRECSGKLFYGCDEDEIEDSVNDVFHDLDGNPPSATSLCRLSALAAVGCLYMRGKEGDRLENAFLPYCQVSARLVD